MRLLFSYNGKEFINADYVKRFYIFSNNGNGPFYVNADGFSISVHKKEEDAKKSLKELANQLIESNVCLIKMENTNEKKQLFVF